MHTAVPHRSGKSVEVNGNSPQLPLIFTGPLVFNWKRRIKGIPVSSLDVGVLMYNQPRDSQRFNRWRSPNMT